MRCRKIGLQLSEIKVRKEHTETCLRRRPQSTGCGTDEILQSPTGDNGVIAENQRSAEYSNPTEIAPIPTTIGIFERARRVALRSAAQG